MKRVTDVERAVRQLDGMYLLPQPDRDRRIAAAAALGVPAVAALERLCRSRTERTRNAAFKALELIGDPATSALVRLLRSRRRDVRSGALGTILRICTPTSLDALREVVLGWLRASRTMNRVRLAVVCGPLAAVGLLFALDGLGWLGLPKVLEGRIGYLNLYTQLASLVLADRELAFRAGLLKDLAQVNDVRVVAMLAAHLDDKGAAHVAAAGLDQGLHRVRAHDAPHFGPEALQGLHAGLKHRNPKLVLAILSALTQIGDERSAAAVRRLVASTKDTQVRAAALEALPAIEASALRTALAGVLLRPASAPDADLLLRPAGMGAAQTQTLVRPSDAPGQDGDHEGMPAGQGAALRPGP